MLDLNMLLNIKCLKAIPARKSCWSEYQHLSYLACVIFSDILALFIYSTVCINVLN